MNHRKNCSLLTQISTFVCLAFVLLGTSLPLRGDEVSNNLEGGQNPCCTFDTSTNDCTLADYQNTSENSPTDKTGAYSDACEAYLECTTEDSWMTKSVVELAEIVGPTTDWFVGGDSVQDAATDIISVYWPDSEDDYAKSLGAGLSTGDYIGVYNCQSAYEKAYVCNTSTGYEPKDFVGAVPNGLSSGSCPTVEGIASDCAFDIWVEIGEVWALDTKKSPVNKGETGFETVNRPWYVEGINLPEVYTAAYTGVYENFDTGMPVVGYVAKFEDASTGVTLALQFVYDTEGYTDYDASCANGISKP